MQYFNEHGESKTIRLGKASRRTAETIKRYVEDLVGSRDNGLQPMPGTRRWLNRIDGRLRSKLIARGLVKSRKRPPARLGPFMDKFITMKSKTLEPGTVLVHKQARANLVDYCGAEKPIREISEGDAVDFREWMLGTKSYTEASVRKQCSKAGELFRYAIKHRRARINPFDAVPTSNKATDHLEFIPADVCHNVLKQFSATDWKLLFALARWGGLRMCSEPRRLRWGDIDWENKRIIITSPKTKRYGKGERVIPMFAEFAPLLAQRFEEAAEGEEYVLPMLRPVTDSAARNRLEKAVARAGAKRWPRIWHNLRATRQTELEDQGFPSHVVCYWLGNSQKTARSSYLQVTDAHFNQAVNIVVDKAVHRAVQ